MAGSTIEEQTEDVVSPILESLGIELVDVEFKREHAGWVLRLYIDKEGGILLDDCSSVSREAAVVLDIEDYIDRPYHLEVSSPGLTRSLKKLKDFEKSVGQPIKIKLYEAVDGNKSFICLLKAINGETLILEIDDKEREVKFSDIAKANLELIQEG